MSDTTTGDTTTGNTTTGNRGGSPHDVLNPQTYGPQPQVRASAARRIAGIVVPPLVFGVFLIGCWYFASYVLLKGNRRILLRPPHRVLKIGFLRWNYLSDILAGMYRSAIVSLIGLAFAIVVGFLLAMIMSQARFAERAILPYMVTLQAIPILAMVPLLALIFGSGMESRVIVCFIFSLYPIMINTLFGLQSAERAHHDLFTLNHASRLTRIFRLQLPSALPAMFAGLRISASLAVIGGIVADFFFGRGKLGLGQLIQQYAISLYGERLIAAILVAAMFGVAVFQSFGWLQRKVVGRWYEGSS